MEEDRLPHLLLYGPPGTGKTSTILACARQLYSEKQFTSMVLEVRQSHTHTRQYISLVLVLTYIEIPVLYRSLQNFSQKVI